MSTENVRHVRMQTYYPLFVVLVAGFSAFLALRWTQGLGKAVGVLAAITTFMAVIALIEVIRRASRRP